MIKKNSLDKALDELFEAYIAQGENEENAAILVNTYLSGMYYVVKRVAPLGRTACKFINEITIRYNEMAKAHDNKKIQ